MSLAISALRCPTSPPIRQALAVHLPEQFVRSVVAAVRTHAGREHLTEAGKIRKAAASIATRISRFMDMAVNLDTPGPVLRKVDVLEQERLTLERQAAALQNDARVAMAARAITEDQVAELLGSFAADMQTYDRDRLKHALGKLLHDVTIDPGALTVRLNWRIPIRIRNKVASPRIHDTIPHAELATYTTLKKAA